MKIAVIGTHGTGKTTLVQHLSKMEQFSDLEVVPEYMRAVAAMGYPINEGATIDSQMLAMQIALTPALTLNKSYLMDRSILDTLVYVERLWNEKQVPQWFYTYHIQIVDAFIKNYDYIFYVRGAEWEDMQITDDGVRGIQKEFYVDIRNGFDKWLRRVDELKLNGKCKMFLVPEGTTEARADFVISHIDEFKGE